MSETKTDAAPEVVSKADYDKVVARAQNFEGKLRDLEVKFERVKDIDPDAIKGKLEDYELLKRKQAAGSPEDIAKLVQDKEAEIRASVQKELDTERNNSKKLMADLRELKLVDKVFTTAASKFNDDCHTDVKEYVRRYGDVDEEGNIYFKDDNGKPRYAKGSTTQLMNPEQFSEWLAEQKPSWAKPVQISGTKQEGSKKAPLVNGKTYSYAELKAMPDGGRSVMAKMTPEQIKAIF